MANYVYPKVKGIKYEVDMDHISDEAYRNIVTIGLEAILTEKGESAGIPYRVMNTTFNKAKQGAKQ